jgi:hypothetical protein
MGVTTCMSLTWLAPSHGSFMIRQSPGSSSATGKAARKCLMATARTPVNDVSPWVDWMIMSPRVSKSAHV